VLRDRGTMKWTAMMLPEHVKLLRDWAKEDFFEEKPELDEQRLEELNEQLSQSLAQSCTISFYRNKQVVTITGKVKKLNPYARTVEVITRDGKGVSIEMDFIIDIARM